MDGASEREISDLVERRILLLKDSLELKLSKDVDSLLKSRFDTTGRILSSAFGLVALVFTAFGIKTFLDVKDLAQKTALEEVKKTLSIDDPNSDFRRNVDQVVARGLIASYLITLAKGKQERFAPELAISEPDLRRLQNLIGDPETTVKDFSDAIEVIVKSSLTYRDDRIRRFIQSLAAGIDQKYSWISEQPEKRAALFSVYPDEGLSAVAKEILKNAKADEKLLLPVMKYLASHDSTSAPLIESLISSVNDRVAKQAMLSVARLNFRSTVFRQKVDTLRNSSRNDDIVDAIKFAIEASKSKPSRDYMFDDDAEKEPREEYAAELIQGSIDKGLRFHLSSSFSRNRGFRLLAAIPNTSTMYFVSAELFKGYAAGSVQRLLGQSAKNEEKFERNVRAFCLIKEGQCFGVVKGYMQAGAELSLKSGGKITQENAPAGVTLRPKNAEKDTPILVSWTDADTNAKSGILSGIDNPEKFDFRVTTALDVESETDD